MILRAAKRLAAHVAVGAVALGLSATAAWSSTVRVTVLGSQWDVGTVQGSFNSLSSTLKSQVWWGDWMLAGALARAVGDQLGGPPAMPYGLLFAFQSSTAGDFYARFAEPSTGIIWTLILLQQPDRTFTFATATPAPAPVPVPAGGLLLLAGLGSAAGMARRKRRAA